MTRSRKGAKPGRKRPKGRLAGPGPARKGWLDIARMMFDVGNLLVELAVRVGSQAGPPPLASKPPVRRRRGKR